ncbi:N-alpha-acetyltransferase 38, NatC auxiliary subunit [Octopus bimaculoides]|uniref:N-alpha-acetyltransferase 38, NatC auxiliary subunit n=1 Tax=Octopus bimaculoides TaxID=37653 RepID=UPI00071E00B3|nr:N-alpha-acetyltransferase 38, NatC auxiliary subunit [Octopus bimaculoides]|eukprot:XP_014778225.1 PREDICTED: N-alpha-acetyltransferase 38, NatC auxiliary subunit-like [Octopus bimaculoides]
MGEVLDGECGESCDEISVIDGRRKLQRWLNKNMKIKMSDGRTLIGIFLCTDRDRNVILGSCEEYLNSPDAEEPEEPRILGLAMVPGHHIVSLHVDDCKALTPEVM